MTFSAYVEGGGGEMEHGAVPPEHAARHVVDRETGIVRWISEVPVEPGEPEIFNYSVKMCESGRYFPIGCYDSNGGAGLTREAGYRAALGEAVERYCSSVYFPDELNLATLADMERHGRALTPAEIALFHPAQRDAIQYSWFDDDTPLAWTQACSLTRRQPVWLPACLLYVPYYPFLHRRGERTIGPGISTGQASGRSLHAAVLSGLYEVVERDAFMISWLHRLPLARIDIQSSRRVWQVFEDRFERPFLRYALFRMASDVEIASILCLVVDESRDPVMVCAGGASHLDPETAALKALTEAVQTRQWAIFMGKRDEPMVIEPDYSNISDFENHVFLYGYGDMLASVSFLLDSENEIAFSDLPRRATGSPREDLRHAIAAVEAVDCEIMLADLTTPDCAACGYTVVKVFIPMMQPLNGDHRHRFLGGRRLYTIPQALGYSAGGIETLNPDPHPYP